MGLKNGSDIRIALIDGLPSVQNKNVRLGALSSAEYPWDSDFFGVPEYRRHADKMLAIIQKENPEAELIVVPFYPKFPSVKKNYRLLAKSIAQAVKLRCTLVCICLEVVGAKYLSAEMLEAYRFANERGAIICVSAGNHRPFQNPLIHKKYTVPVVGLKVDGILPHQYSSTILKAITIGIYGGKDVSCPGKEEIVNCSSATARFTGFLSKLVVGNHEIKRPLDLIDLLVEKNPHSNYPITILKP